MKLSHFNFNLPEELLAEFPTENRDESRLMVVNRKTGTIDYEFYKKNHINFTYNASIVGDFIFNATKTWLNKPSFTGFGVGYGMETLVGPVEIKYSWSPETHFSAFWFNLGFVF